MGQMFDGCTSLTTVPAFDTSSVTDMGSMFYGCTSLTTVPAFDTSSVTFMNGMFNGCTSLTTVPAFDTSNVTNMDNMFHSCNSLQSLPEFDCTNVTGINFFFGFGLLTGITELGGFKNLKISVTYFINMLPNLTRESCINILNGLYDFTGNGETPKPSQGKLKVHANFLTAVGDDISIGTSKGWTITA
jgi:surface protein